MLFLFMFVLKITFYSALIMRLSFYIKGQVYINRKLHIHMKSCFNHLLCTFLFIMSSSILFGQSPESIVLEMEGKSGKEYVILANRASEAFYKKRKYTEANEYAQEAWRVAKGIGEKELLAEAYINWAKAILKKPASSSGKRANRRQAAKNFKDAADLSEIDATRLYALKQFKRLALPVLSKSEKAELNAEIAVLDKRVNPVIAEIKEDVKEVFNSKQAGEKPRRRYAADEIKAVRELGKVAKEREAELKAMQEEQAADFQAKERLYEAELEERQAALDTMSITEALQAAMLAEEQRLTERLLNEALMDSIRLISIESEITQLELENERAEAEKSELKALIIGASGVALTLLIFLFVAIRLNRRVKREKKKSDSLLANILPKHIISTLKGKTVNKDADIIAEMHKNVSVMFLDFKGFSSFAKEKKDDPKEVVRLLNLYFKQFDDIIVNKYGLEKIKTIGDAYMCAAGIHPSKGDRKSFKKKQAEKLVNAALDINRFIKNEAIIAQKKGRPYFDGRIGIHTGDVIAGVVGEKKYAYDIWGDTVNTASRVESNGQINTVNVSESTKALLDKKFNFGLPRRVNAKNIGLLNIYDVKRV